MEIPSTGRYKPLYNPGGPGNNPAPGVRYTAASPPIAEHVMIALNNPLTVTYRPRSRTHLLFRWHCGNWLLTCGLETKIGWKGLDG